MPGVRRAPRSLSWLATICALLTFFADAQATRHAPGMSLTAELFAPSPQAEDPASAEADSSATPATEPEVAPGTPGTITGYVRDQESGKGLPYTNIVLYEVKRKGRLIEAGGSIALTGGQYFARVNPGTYEVRFLYLGYENFTAQDVVVAPGSTVTLDASMKVKPIEFEAMTIQAQKITNTAVAQIAEKKKAVAVQEAITAEEISKSTDSDAAEALERVTGLSVVGGKFVFVRGLGDRYSSTTLNGAPLSSPEPGRETVPLDIFPAAMLDNIVVQKAFTPDMDGNFGGGNIDVRTRRGVDERTFNQKISYGFNQSVLDQDFYTYDGGAWDLLAYDDGTRDIDRVFPDSGDRPFLRQEGLTTEEERIAATFRGTNVWTPRLVEGPPNFGYAGLFSDSFAFGERKGSFLAAASYSHSASTDDFVRYDVRDVEEPAQQETRSVQSERGVLIGLTGAATFQPTQDSNLQYNLLYTRAGEDQVRRSEGQNDSEDSAFLTHTLKYVQRDLLTHVLQGRHNFGGHGSELHWLLSTSNATRDEPDNRFAKFNWADNDTRELEDGSTYTKGRYSKAFLGTGAQRLWSETEESSEHFQVNWTASLPELPWIQRMMRFGFAYRRRDRVESDRRFGVVVPSAAYNVPGRSGRLEDTLTQDEFAEHYAQAGDYNTDERTGVYDAVDAERTTTAMYGMFDIDFFQTIRVNAGARFETSRQSASSLSLTGQINDLPAIRSSANTSDWLPAANATWRISDAMQTRLAYSRTLNRPQLRELSAIRRTDFELDEEVAGNPFVRPAKVEAVDFRFEIFPAPRSYAAFSAFDKTIDDAIQISATQKAGGGRTIFPFNGEPGGKLRGWEVEWRGPMVDVLTAGSQTGVALGWAATRPLWLLARIPGLDGLDDATLDFRVVNGHDVPALENWGFTFNYTSITSEIDVSPGSAENEARFVLGPDGQPLRVEDDIITNRLTGQADSALNIGHLLRERAAGLLRAAQGLRRVAGVGRRRHPVRCNPSSMDSAFSTAARSEPQAQVVGGGHLPGR